MADDSVHEKEQMNEASKRRVEWSRPIAAVYAGHPKVEAIILGGSTARGVASNDSDIDIGLFWSRIASAKEREELIRRAGGQMSRIVENHRRYSHSNPRSEGKIEIVEFQSTGRRPQLRLDLEHETVAGTEQVIIEVLSGNDTSLEKQELLSVIQAGIVLHGEEVVGKWREKAQDYPDDLAEKMVSEQLLGIAAHVLDMDRSANSQDWRSVHEVILGISRRLFLSLLGLNRAWAYTDNPSFKGLKEFCEELRLQPHGFANRLGQLTQSNAFTASQDTIALIEEVIALVELHMPSLDVSGEREMLEQVAPLGFLTGLDDCLEAWLSPISAGVILADRELADGKT